MEFAMKLLKLMLAWGLVMVSAATAQAQSGTEVELTKYGRQLPRAFKAEVITYKAITQTMRTPLIAYVISFTTNDSAFHSNPAAATDNAAYVENTGKRLIWEARFCTNELKSIMRRAKINVVTGDLQNSSGKTQFMAMCNRD